MKIYPFLLTSLISALSLSCKDDQVNQGGGTVEGKLITLGISSSDYNVASRTQDESSWATGDEIGAFAFDASTTDAIEGWQNVKYSCSETGSTAIFKSDIPLAIDKEDTPVSIVAYYPYKSDIQGTYYNIDLSNQNDGTSAYDFMYGTSEPCNYGSDEMSNVNITFSHRFSKIRLKVVNMAGEQLSTSDGKISGMPVETSVNLANGAMETSTAAGDLIPYWNSTDGYYEAVIFPSALSDNYKFSFNAGGKSHEWVFTDIEDIDLPYFNRGYQYTFSIFMNDEGMVEVGRLESIEEGNSNSPWAGGEEVIGIASAVTYSFYPENLATNAFADTELKITFRDKTPKIGTEGYIRIYDAETNEVADEINMADKHTPFHTSSSQTEPITLHTWMNIIGMQSKKVVINYYPVEIEGKTVVIKPHCQKLQPGKKYYVTVDKTAIDVDGFYGITGADWTFTTKANPTDADVKVSHTDENADFYTLQGAIDYMAVNVANDVQKTIILDAGIYKEVINLRDQYNITITGNTLDYKDVVLKYRNYNGLNGSTNDGMEISHDAPMGTDVTKGCNRSVLMVAGKADKIKFENMTIQNSYGWDDSDVSVQHNDGQAEAVLVRNSGAVSFVNCRMLSFQDTMIAGNTSTYSAFLNCYIAGSTDFIWSCGQVALFSGCDIVSVNDTRAVMQARIGRGRLGYVFRECNFKAPEGSTGATLIYPTKGSTDKPEDDNLTFLNCNFAKTYIDNFVAFVEEKNDKGEVIGIITLHPSPATPTEGCKMYNCKIENTETDAYSSLKEDWKNSVYQLNETEYDEKYGSIEKIMNTAGYSDPSWFN